MRRLPAFDAWRPVTDLARLSAPPRTAFYSWTITGSLQKLRLPFLGDALYSVRGSNPGLARKNKRTRLSPSGGDASLGYFQFSMTRATPWHKDPKAYEVRRLPSSSSYAAKVVRANAP